MTQFNTPSAVAVPPPPKQVPVIVFGEVLYDRFPDGVEVLGGAPFNVAWGLTGLGCVSRFVSAVGEDPYGQNIRKKMCAWGMDLSGLAVSPEYATGLVEVTIQENEPSYRILENRAWDHISDEGFSANRFIYHGSLALRSERNRTSLEAIVQRSSGKRFFDVNLRPPFLDLERVKKWIHGAEWLKLNIDELKIVLGTETLPLQRAEKDVIKLCKDYGVKNVLLTAGAQGAAIISRSHSSWCRPAPKPDPFVDTVGAGDAFSAYTLNGILRGMEVDSIVKEASRFAAKVCGIQGATTEVAAFYR
jgi:fructokinase